jgi:hypothetical protein
MDSKETITSKVDTDKRQNTGNKENTADTIKCKSKRYQCPVCDSKELIMRHEASYVYSYVIDNDAPGLMNSDEFLSYLYDKRELKEARTYIECSNCGTQYPSDFLKGELISEKDDSKERAFH